MLNLQRNYSEVQRLNVLVKLLDLEEKGEISSQNYCVRMMPISQVEFLQCPDLD